MYILDTTSIIAYISDLTHDLNSIENADPTRLKHMQMQILEEKSNPKNLLLFFQSLPANLYTLQSSFFISNNIISIIGGPHEKDRWENFKQTLSLLVTLPESPHFLITANKKLRKKSNQNSNFIYHSARSLIGI